MKNRLEQIIKIKLSEAKFADKKMDNPCWDGYEPYGTKIVNGKEVPNCVPKQKMEDIDFAQYPWEKCLEDQEKAYGSKKIAEKVCGAIKAGMRSEDFVIPSPSAGEDENTFVSRCIKAIYNEYGQEQSSAICYNKWREK